MATWTNLVEIQLTTISRCTLFLFRMYCRMDTVTLQELDYCKQKAIVPILALIENSVEDIGLCHNILVQLIEVSATWTLQDYGRICQLFIIICSLFHPLSFFRSHDFKTILILIFNAQICPKIFALYLATQFPLTLFHLKILAKLKIFHNAPILGLLTIFVHVSSKNWLWVHIFRWQYFSFSTRY